MTLRSSKVFQGHYLANGAPDSENARVVWYQISDSKHSGSAHAQSKSVLRKDNTRFLCDMTAFLYTYNRLGMPSRCTFNAVGCPLTL